MSIDSTQARVGNRQTVYGLPLSSDLYLGGIKPGSDMDNFAKEYNFTMMPSGFY